MPVVSGCRCAVFHQVSKSSSLSIFSGWLVCWLPSPCRAVAGARVCVPCIHVLPCFGCVVCLVHMCVSCAMTPGIGVRPVYARCFPQREALSCSMLLRGVRWCVCVSPSSTAELVFIPPHADVGLSRTSRPPRVVDLLLLPGLPLLRFSLATLARLQSLSHAPASIPKCFGFVCIPALSWARSFGSHWMERGWWRAMPSGVTRKRWRPRPWRFVLCAR